MTGTVTPDRFPFAGTVQTDFGMREVAAARVTRVSRGRVYLAVYREDGIAQTEIAKQMQFDGGRIYVTNPSGQRVEIGTYQS